MSISIMDAVKTVCTIFVMAVLALVYILGPRRIARGWFGELCSRVITWWNLETAKGLCDREKSDLRARLSKRAARRLEQLGDLDEDLLEGDVAEMPHIPLAYKYSRIARVELCAPGKSEENVKCAYHLIRKKMEANGVRPSQIMKSIHLAVQLTFVQDRHEVEAHLLGDVLGQMKAKAK